MELKYNQTLIGAGLRDGSTVDAHSVIRNKWPLSLLIGRMNDTNIPDPINKAQGIVREAVRVLRAHKDHRVGVLFDIAGIFKICVIKTESEIYQIATEWQQGEFILSELTNAQKSRLLFLQHLKYCPFNMTFK